MKWQKTEEAEQNDLIVACFGEKQEKSGSFSTLGFFFLLAGDEGFEPLTKTAKALILLGFKILSPISSAIFIASLDDGNNVCNIRYYRFS